MECPTCKTFLVEDSFAGLPTHKCGSCNGFVITFDEINEIKISSGVTTEMIEKVFSDGVKGSLPCPYDGSLMTASNHYGEVIDCCPTCKAIWFDRDELGKIVNLNVTNNGTAAPVLVEYFLHGLFSSLIAPG